MSIDYMILYPCDIRKNMPPEQMWRLLAARNRARAAVAELRRANPALSEEAIIADCKLTVDVRQADGTVGAQQIGVSELVAQAAPLERLAPLCKGCPARVRDRSFGCTGHVNYPISSAVEEFLVSRLPEDHKAPTLKALLGLLEEQGILGRQIDVQRNDATRYERRAPALRKWGSWLSRKTVSSSQILQLLLTLNEMKPELLSSIAKMLWLPDVPAIPKAPNPKKDNDGIAQMKGFMAAVVIAGRTNAQLHVER